MLRGMEVVELEDWERDGLNQCTTEDRSKDDGSEL